MKKSLAIQRRNQRNKREYDVKKVMVVAIHATIVRLCFNEVHDVSYRTNIPTVNVSLLYFMMVNRCRERQVTSAR